MNKYFISLMEEFTMTKRDRIQHLLITHLREEGQGELKLPDGLIIEVGVIKEGKSGDIEKFDDYCWVIASQKNRTVSMDSYNLGLRYFDDNSKIVVEDETIDCDGQPIKVFSVV